MVILQNIHAFNCRSEKESVFKIPLKNNKLIVYAVVGALLVHIAFMNISFLQPILKTNPVSLTEFIMIVFMALPLLLAMETFKKYHKKGAKNL